MEGELIYVSIISLIGMCIFFYFNKSFWLTKWEKNLEFEEQKQKNDLRFKKYKIKQSNKMKNPADKNPLEQAKDLIKLAGRLDPDQLGDLIDTFVGGGGEILEGNDYASIIERIVGENPELVTQFLSGLQNRQNTPQQIIR